MTGWLGAVSVILGLINWNKVGKMKKNIRRFLGGLQVYSKQTQFVQNRRPVLAEHSEKDFDDFLTLLIYYMCIGCAGDIDRNFDRNYRRASHWVNSHHCGLFSKTLSAAPMTNVFSGLISAFSVFSTHREQSENLEIPLAQAYFSNENPKGDIDRVLLSTLNYFYVNRHKNFIRHGLEELECSTYKADEIYPAKGALKQESLSTSSNCFAVEIDRPPFLNCFQHGSVFPWFYCGGVITIEDLKGRNGRLKFADDREHFYAESDIRVQDWNFIYSLRAKHKRSLNFDPNLLARRIVEIKSSGANCIEIGTLRKFFHAINLLEQRHEAFKLINC